MPDCNSIPGEFTRARQRGCVFYRFYAGVIEGFVFRAFHQFDMRRSAVVFYRERNRGMAVFLTAAFL